MIEGDELAAAIAALAAIGQPTEETPEPEISAWKRAARLEAIGVQ